eukprot:TRINITY_DN3052_c0_g1_i1.p1 TRINITY_DN3052_c0_g1~~TRINITY_DN3052_c0_g1_i1.p1  ORF type:complete len:587 (+),score=165.47 TRINITY_DN3052_c0_g1_i1:69-1829(+)
MSASAAEQLIHEDVKEAQGEFFTINVFEASEPRRIRFAARQPGVVDEYELTLSDNTLHVLVEKDRKLLEPDQRQKLVDFLLGRLSIGRDTGRVQLSIAGFLPETGSLGKASIPQKVPIQRLSFAERTKIKKQFEVLEATRDQRLQEKQQQQKEKFLQELALKKATAAQAELERQQRILREKEDRRALKAAENEQERQSALIKGQLEAKRENAVIARLEERKKRDDERLETMLARAAQQESEHQKRIEESRQREQKNTEDEKQRLAERQRMIQVLEQKRSVTHEKLDSSFTEKERAYAAKQLQIRADLAAEKARRQAASEEQARAQRDAKAAARREAELKRAQTEAREEQRSDMEAQREQQRRLQEAAHIAELKRQTASEAEANAQRRRDEIGKRKANIEDVAAVKAAKEAQAAQLEQKRTEAIEARMQQRAGRDKEYSENIRRSVVDRQQHEQEVKAAAEVARLKQQAEKAEARRSHEAKLQQYLQAEQRRSSNLLDKSHLRDHKEVSRIATYRASVTELSASQQLKLGMLKQEQQRRAQESSMGALSKQQRWEQLEKEREAAITERERVRVQREANRARELVAAK